MDSDSVARATNQGAAGAQLEAASKLPSSLGREVEQHAAELQNKLEAALGESERRFALFVHNLLGAAWMKDLNGHYDYANPEAERIFQTPLAALRGKTEEQVFAPDIAAQFRANDRLAISAGHAIRTIESLPQHDGIHHSIVVKFPISDREGVPILVGGVAFDITEQRKAEETTIQLAEQLLASNGALLASNDTLRCIQQQLDLVTSNMAAAVSHCSRDFRYLWVSQSYAAWIRRPVEEIAGRSIRDVIGDRGYEDIRPYMERLLAGERSNIPPR